MILRVVDKETGFFIRDDFTFDEETEKGLYVEPAQDMYKPKWDFDKEEWVEGGTKPDPQPRPITEDERLRAVEMAVLTLMME